MAAAKPNPFVEKGDHVYARHPKRGAVTVRVTATGRDGFKGVCDKGERWGVPWSDYLGHKARMLQNYDVVDQGADGAILQGQDGKRRFLAGGIPMTEEIATATVKKSSTPESDPLTEGLDRLEKALAGLSTVSIIGRRAAASQTIFIKAMPGAAIKNRPGLSLQAKTDKAGHQTHRWVKLDQSKPANDAAAKGEPPAAAPAIKHGDSVQFQHGQVQGEGKIVASGRDGVTVQDGEGREHAVRHEHLTAHSPSAPDEAAPAGAGETDGKAAAPDAAGDAGAAPKGEGDALFDPKDMALPKDASQPVNTSDDLFAKAPEALDQLQNWLNKGKGVCSQLGYETMKTSPDDVDWSNPPKGGLLFIAPVKGEKRSKEKVAQDYGGDWSQLLDPVRCSIAVDSFDDLKKTMAALKGSGGLVLARKPKDRFANPTPEGYRDVLMNVRLPNGLIGEVQLHMKSMLAAKGEGHHYYEITRKLYAKGKDNFTDEDKKAYQDAVEKQQEIYSNAWSNKKTGNQGLMQKALGGPLAAAFEYFEHDNAKFRRKGGFGGVDDVLHGDKWVPYEGDGNRAYLMGDKIDDPLAGAGDAAGNEKMAKAIDEKRFLFFKAAVPAQGDLFAAPVQVSGHIRAGKYVAPFTSTRKKKPEKSNLRPIPKVFKHHEDHPHMDMPIGQLAEKHGGIIGHIRNGTGNMRADLKYKGGKLGMWAKHEGKTVRVADLGQSSGHNTLRDLSHAISLGLADGAKYEPVASYSHAEPTGFPDGSVHAIDTEGKKMRGDAKHGEMTPRFKTPEAAAARFAPKKVASDSAAEAPLEPASDPDLSGLPDGARFEEGRGPLGNGKWMVRHEHKNLSNLHATKEAAAKEAREWHKNATQSAARKAASDVKDAEIAARLRAGESPTDADLRHLGLHVDRHSRFDYLSPVVQRLFSISKAKVREAMGDALKEHISDMGAKTSWGHPRKALMNAAAWDRPKPTGLAPKAETEPAGALAAAPDMKHFYVSAVDGAKKHLVAGPYASHQEALDQVEHVRSHADKNDPRAHFMAWGTAGTVDPVKTPLGENWKKPDSA